MATLLIAMLAVGADPQASTTGTQPPAEVAKQAPQRSPRALSDALTAALKAESHALPEKRHDAARDLIAMYHEISANRRVAKTLRERWTVRIRIRLQTIRKRLKREALAERKNTKRPANVKQRDGAGGVLAQQGPLGQPPRGGNRGNPFGAGGAAKNDAADLIDVITTTIAPDSWEAAGGLGTIIYYPPLHALIIRQRAEVHGQLGGVLRQLRRAQ